VCLLAMQVERCWLVTRSAQFVDLPACIDDCPAVQVSPGVVIISIQVFNLFGTQPQWSGLEVHALIGERVAKFGFQRC